MIFALAIVVILADWLAAALLWLAAGRGASAGPYR